MQAPIEALEARENKKEYDSIYEALGGAPSWGSSSCPCRCVCASPSPPVSALLTSKSRLKLDIRSF